MRVEEIREHLASLGLDPNGQFTAEELKKAWRSRCVEHHPDKGGDPEKFRQTTHAYKLLTDPSYREGHKGDQGPRLDMTIVIPVRFEDAFFGAKVSASWNRIEIKPSGDVVISEKQEIEFVTVLIPPGHMGDFNQTFKGRGVRCGDRVGDCHVNFRPVPNQRFRVDGQNVVTEEQVPLDVLLKGGEIEVQTLWGIKTLKVPAGTLPGHPLKIKKAGVAQVGDHMVVCQPLFPTADDLKTDEAWRGLDINWSQTEEALAAQQDQQFEQVFINLGGYSFGSATTTTTGGL